MYHFFPDVYEAQHTKMISLAPIDHGHIDDWLFTIESTRYIVTLPMPLVILTIWPLKCECMMSIFNCEKPIFHLVMINLRLFWYVVPHWHLEKKMVFCFKNCSDLLWEKIVLKVSNMPIKLDTLQNQRDKLYKK